MGGYVPGLAASPYDGKFAIVRLWYPTYPGWSYDYPEMEQHLNLILPELTAITPSPNGGNIFRMDDPELMKFPLAYLSEPGPVWLMPIALLGLLAVSYFTRPANRRVSI